MPDTLPKIKYAEQEAKSFQDALAFFQSLADNSPSLIWMSGPDMLRNFTNRRWLEFTGRQLEQELGSGWLDGVHPDDRAACMHACREHFDQRVEYSIKYRLRRKDGVYRWVMDNGSPFHLPDGRFAGYIGSCLDVTESVSEIASLENQNNLIRSITDNVTVGLFLTDAKGRCVLANPAAERMTGYRLDELRGKVLHGIIHHTYPDGRPFPRSECPMDMALANMTQIKDFETHYIRKDGSHLPVSGSASPISNKGRLMGTVLEIRDLTERRSTENLIKKNEARFRALIEKSSDAVLLMDAKAVPLYASPSLKRILGYDNSSFIGQDTFGLVHSADLAYIKAEYQKMVDVPGATMLAEMRVRHADGTWRWIESVNTNLLHDPNIGAVVINFRDITERKSAEEKAKYQYYHDSLTDLPNRNCFTERLAEMVSGHGPRLCGVLVVDLDRFKMINESLGHAVGDQLIKDVGARLGECLDGKDLLARLGGDEYGILMPSITREEEIGRTCSKILDSLKRAIRIGRHELFITPSIGIAVYPYDGMDVSTLLKNADSALYRAKEIGRNNFQYYTPSMNAMAFQQLAMENTLRRALDNDEFLVYYQPQVDVNNGKIVQVEALIRWMHPELGLTFPDEFIGIAETTGLIQPIGEWVLRKACEDVKSWERSGHRISLAVNLSARQLKQRHLVRNVRKVISETGFNSSLLELEITESVLLDDSHMVYNTLIQLKKDGIKFAIDDFNTGYSSLNYLKHYPVNSLKLDRSFIKGIPVKEKDSAIANAVLNLAHSLKMEVVAEGVERPDQLKFLKERNCDKVQGYLFSPPVPADELLRLLNNN